MCTQGVDGRDGRVEVWGVNDDVGASAIVEGGHAMARLGGNVGFEFSACCGGYEGGEFVVARVALGAGAAREQAWLPWTRVG